MTARLARKFDYPGGRGGHADHLLAAGSRDVDIAERMGITTRTLRRWKAINEFAAALDQRIIERRRELLGRLREIDDAALATLGQHFTSDDADPRLALKFLESRRIMEPIEQETKGQGNGRTVSEMIAEARAELDSLPAFATGDD